MVLNMVVLGALKSWFWRGSPPALSSRAMIRLGHIEYSNCIPVHAQLLEHAAADIEIVRLTLELVRATGLADYQLNLGHAGILAPAPREVREGSAG